VIWAVGVVPAASGDHATQHEKEVRQWSHKPKVKRPTAKRAVQRTLMNLEGWAERHAGWIDCRHGKVDWHDWRCRVRWLNGMTCRTGRFRVIGAGFQSGRSWLWIHAHWLIGRSGGWVAKNESVHCSSRETSEEFTGLISKPS
jgi:hypothetical protein